MTVQIEGFEDLEAIGQGGFGEVYRARQPAFDRTVAIKVLTGGVSDEVEKRFEREAKAMGRASSHPHILPVFSSGRTDDGRLYLVMPWAGGGSLGDRLTTGGLPWDEVRTWAPAIAEALHHAHGVGLLHRDVKPDNVLFTDRGDALLADFGIARLLDQTTRTATGTVTATVLYAAPEVLDGAPASVASDVYSLGATLYHALTGRPAFHEPDLSFVALLRRIALDEPDRAALERAEVPAAVTELVLQCMAKDPGHRPGSAGEVAARLRTDGTSPRRADEGLVTVAHPAPPPPEPATAPPSRRRPGTFAVVAAVLAVALLATVGLLWWRSSSEGTDIAATAPTTAPGDAEPTATPGVAVPIGSEAGGTEPATEDPATEEPGVDLSQLVAPNHIRGLDLALTGELTTSCRPDHVPAPVAMQDGMAAVEGWTLEIRPAAAGNLPPSYADLTGDGVQEAVVWATCRGPSSTTSGLMVLGVDPEEPETARTLLEVWPDGPDGGSLAGGADVDGATVKAVLLRPSEPDVWAPSAFELRGLDGEVRAEPALEAPAGWWPDWLQEGACAQLAAALEPIGVDAAAGLRFLADVQRQSGAPPYVWLDATRPQVAVDGEVPWVLEVAAGTATLRSGTAADRAWADRTVADLVAPEGCRVLGDRTFQEPATAGVDFFPRALIEARRVGDYELALQFGDPPAVDFFFQRPAGIPWTVPDCVINLGGVGVGIETWECLIQGDPEGGSWVAWVEIGVADIEGYVATVLPRGTPYDPWSAW